ncbi:SpoIID/LytB domain-containing protein [Desulfofundulus thermosubterraneus]|uniref:Stage II sporulation protein D n=1 Tax=Desulfofundulus thermosubterraneus DSM 16057 TaxID=1121432 RepID=A0A1M6DV76_9FIRM|nr:SpoIID/LytB domain-containing protein [Desulfofundulus thermosubterraneus]SHI77154.1 stage II sporulation protein D [Desulfofundulus thermosubterraneus DSM 16057]
MLKPTFTRAVIVTTLIGLLIAGCTRAAPRKPVPPAPGREPTISLYVNETGERKNIKLEDYVAGVVAAEMEPTWPVNALAAQAILARTFTMENIKAGRVKKLHGTDASTSPQEFQAYDPSRINDNVRQAVARTRGEVAMYRGDYIKAWFNACDGGVTASAAEGLAYTKTPTPYVRAGVRDNCLSITTPENRHWERRIPLEQVRAAVTKITGRDPGPITSVRIVRRGPSGRAEQLQVGKATVSGPALRLALGSEWVRSMLLTSARVEGNALVLTGKGFGHGVGMCQWGARLLAQKGRSPEDIVRFYFKDIEIRKLWQ